MIDISKCKYLVGYWCILKDIECNPNERCYGRERKQDNKRERGSDC